MGNLNNEDGYASSRDRMRMKIADLEHILAENTICNCSEICTEDTCPCMNIPCGDMEEICQCPRGCLSECTCVRRPDETRGVCDT